MKINSFEKFMAKISSGSIALGCCVTLGDPAVTEIVAASGMDFCWIDGEHGILDRVEMQMHVMALRGTDCAPLVRVPANDHTEIKKIIDLAPAGVIIPMINCAEDARKAVAACRYPMDGGNRGCGFRRGHNYGTVPVADYFERSKEEPLVILQIEHIEAYRNLDAILEVPGIGSILVGPYDLSASMGIPGDFDDSELNRIFDDICDKCVRKSIPVGVYTERDFDRWRARKVCYMGIANDTNAMLNGLKFMISASEN